MKYTSFIRYITTSSWMLTPQVASAFLPVLNNTLAGLEFEREEPLQTSFVNIAHSNTSGDNKVAIHTLSGIMLKHDQECGPDGTQTLARKILELDKESDIIGHVLVIDSGGGAADAVPPLADAIKELKKPIIAYVDGMAASAAIYAASFCNSIIAAGDMCMVGCIGTMIEFAEFPNKTKLPNGSILLRVYADQSGEKNADFEQALEGNVQLLRDNLLNPLAERFIADMKANRPGVLAEQLKGKTYFAKDVVGSLIDSIGSLSSAIDMVAQLANKQEDVSPLQTNKNMYENLENLPSCTGLVVQEGGVYLNEEQLADINTALEANRESSGLLETIASKDAIIAERDSRIAELEAALAEPAGAAETAGTEQDPLNTTIKDEDPLEYCKKVKNQLR